MEQKGISAEGTEKEVTNTVESKNKERFIKTGRTSSYWVCYLLSKRIKHKTKAGTESNSIFADRIHCDVGFLYDGNAK